MRASSFCCIAIAAVAAVTACRPQTQVTTTSQPANATIRNASGTSLGVLTLTPAATGVRITGSLTSLPPGQHGIHLHTVGMCDAPGFTTAGGHLNPSGAHHGLSNPAGPHAGDLPNITADAGGAALVDLIATPQVSVTGLFDTDGTAVVIHATADDQMTDPAGNSGARIACGVVAH